MIIGGVNVDELEAGIPETMLPTVVAGRVLQLDGDCLAYECGYNDEAPFNQCTANFKAALASRMAMAGADHCIIHLTGGDKGGRFDIALVKEYQANRKDKAKPIHLAGLKAWCEEQYPIKDGALVQCINHTKQEADDGMAQGQFKAIMNGTPELSIIHSMDKDLGMCSGLHMDWYTYIHETVDGFGEIYLDESGSSKKIKGKGTSFFWAQLLMGDTADNIPGLPKLGMPVLDEVDPLKKPRKDDANPKLCGAVMAWKILKDVKDDLTAFTTVVRAYQSYYGAGAFEFTDWRGRKYKLTNGHMLLEQARLLWMRRVVDECPSVFFNQVVHGLTWDGSKV